MRTFFLALPILLSGCGSDSIEEMITDYVEENVINSKTRTVNIGLNNDISLKENNSLINDNLNHIQKKKNKEYNQNLELCNYELIVIDDINERVLENNICINDNPVITVDVTGDATLRLKNIINHEEYNVSSFYTVTGSATLLTNETSVEIELNNENWSYVTIDNHDIIEDIQIISTNDSSQSINMELHQENDFSYYSGYISNNAKIRISTSYDTYVEHYLTYTKNKHFPLSLNIGNNGDTNFIIIDNWDVNEHIVLDRDAFVNQDVYILESWITDISNENLIFTELDFKGEFNDTDRHTLFTIPLDKTKQIKLSDITSAIKVNQPLHLTMEINSNNSRDYKVTITLFPDGSTEVADASSLSGYYDSESYYDDYYYWDYGYYSDYSYLLGNYENQYYYYDYNTYEYYNYACDLYSYTCTLDNFISNNDILEVSSEVIISNSEQNFEITEFNLVPLN